MSVYSMFATGVNKLLHSVGYQIIRLPTPPMNCRFKAISRNRIDLVLDIGANTGQYAMELRKSGYKGRIVSFEPLPEAFLQLSAHAASDPLWDVRNAAVGAEPGRLPMHVSLNSVSSSLLPITQASVDAAPSSGTMGVVEVEVVTLQAILESEEASRTLLKIDTQGYEWQVLAGCGEAITHALLIDVEMSLTPLYSGQKLWDEVDPWIRSKGFRLFGMDTGFWNRDSGELLQVDGLYVRA